MERESGLSESRMKILRRFCTDGTAQTIISPVFHGMNWIENHVASHCRGGFSGSVTVQQWMKSTEQMAIRSGVGA